MVFFELPLLRNAQKRHKKINKINKKKQKGTYLPDLLAICQIYPRFIFFSLNAPCTAYGTRSSGAIVTACGLWIVDCFYRVQIPP
jgi:hypothetical protein